MSAGVVYGNTQQLLLFFQCLIRIDPSGPKSIEQLKKRRGKSGWISSMLTARKILRALAFSAKMSVYGPGTVVAMRHHASRLISRKLPLTAYSGVTTSLTSELPNDVT